MTPKPARAKSKRSSGASGVAMSGKVKKLQSRTQFARLRTEAARRQARLAKQQAKAARKLFKSARQVAKRAKAELAALTKKLKKVLAGAVPVAELMATRNKGRSAKRKKASRKRAAPRSRRK